MLLLAECFLEMRTLHEDMEQQMSVKLASIESARNALAAATIEAQVMLILNLYYD